MLRASDVAHLMAMHAHEMTQYAHQVEAQAMQIARLRQDLEAARLGIERLTDVLGKVGAYLHDGPELEMP